MKFITISRTCAGVASITSLSFFALFLGWFAGLGEDGFDVFERSAARRPFALLPILDVSDADAPFLRGLRLTESRLLASGFEFLGDFHGVDFGF